MAKVVKKSDVVPVHCMQDGDVAEVISGIGDLSEGTVVQRYDDKIILIGEPWGKGFSGLIESSMKGNCCVKVKILPKGTLIQL